MRTIGDSHSEVPNSIKPESSIFRISAAAFSRMGALSVGHRADGLRPGFDLKTVFGRTYIAKFP